MWYDAGVYFFDFSTMSESTEEKSMVPPVSQNGAPDKDIEDNALVAALSYLGVLVAVPLFLKRESPYCQFHAKQGLVLLVMWILGSFVFWFPIIGWGLAIAVFVLNVIAFIKALQGQKWEMPVLGDIAKKINI